jgi:hypothetical protein
MTTTNGLRFNLRFIQASFATAAALVFLVLAGSTSSADAAQAASVVHPVRPPVTAAAMETWRKAVAALPPGKSGCFQVAYPSRTLVARDCGKPKPLIFPRTPTNLRPLDEHSGGDLSLISPGSITTATGVMQKMERVTILGEIDQTGKLLN